MRLDKGIAVPFRINVFVAFRKSMSRFVAERIRDTKYAFHLWQDTHFTGFIFLQHHPFFAHPLDFLTYNVTSVKLCIILFFVYVEFLLKLDKPTIITKAHITEQQKITTKLKHNNNNSK